MARLYLLGAVLILVAIGYQYREEIRTLVTSKLERKQSPRHEDLGTESDSKPDSSAESEGSANYYNPPFDPKNPPEPIISKSGTRLITLNELAAHGHSGPLKPIWLAILGKVYDVDKGAEHYYGPKGGYNFFTGE